jgi:glycolate oxidase
MDQRSVRRLVADIGRVVGKHKIKTAPEILTCYAFDATNIQALPHAVAFPVSTDDVRSIVTHCRRSGVPIIPRGAGTGFAGGTVPLSGGIVISTEKLNRIIGIDREAKSAVVQSGLVNAALQREASKAYLMFPPDPSSLEVATIGGNIAQDAGGPRALKYGVTRDYVVGVEFVTADGRVIECDPTWRRSKLWDPLTTLLTGSEGTLGVITGACLRLLPMPQSFRTLLAFFDTTVAAAEAVSRVLDSGVLPAAVELMDAETLACIRSYVDVAIPTATGCALLVETDGRAGEAEEGMGQVEKALAGSALVGARTAASDEEREDLWKMRRAISPSLARIAPSKLNEDVCVPRSKLPALVARVGDLAKKYALRVPTFGHAGDGNLHVNVMLNKKRKDEVRRGEALIEELFEVTLSLGGSISGEHGIGVTKLRFLPGQLGEAGLELQKMTKRAFDPRSMINPGKVVGAS